MKKLETGINVKMTCIEGEPEAEVLKILKDHVLVYATNRKMFRVNKKSLIEGASEIQAIDFEEELVLPVSTEDIPEEIQKAMFTLTNNMDSIEKKSINENVSAFRFGMGGGKGKGKSEKMTKPLATELIDFIKTYSDTPYGTQHGMILNKEGHLGILALAIEKFQVYESVLAILKEENCTKVAFTISCENNIEGALIEGDYNFFQKIYYLTAGNWYYGVLPYKFEKGKSIVFGETDWANEIWSERMEMELMRADMVKKLVDMGRAYNDKIIVKKYVENSEGYFYEGTIDEKKIESKLKSFLEKNNLKINNREKVNEYLSNIGKGISLEKDKHGYFTVRCGSFVAAGKRSKTRAYLEALEHIVTAI